VHSVTLPLASCSILPACSITVAWAGDCRAVVGLAVDTPHGPRCLVHSLTQDHKPKRFVCWQGLAGRVVDLGHTVAAVDLGHTVAAYGLPSHHPSCY